MQILSSMCSVEGCGKASWVKGLCSPHYKRNYRYGNPLVQKHASPGQGYRKAGEYPIVSQNGETEYLHRVLAERALGRPLPPKAEVHHVNGRRDQSRPGNLVICPDRAYHMLLHRRQKMLGISFSEDY